MYQIVLRRLCRLVYKKDIRSRDIYEEVLKKEEELTPETISDDDNTKCWFCVEEFKSAKLCSKCEITGAPHLVCNKKRISKDHCYLTGRSRKLAHNKCNLNT